MGSLNTLPLRIEREAGFLMSIQESSSSLQKGSVFMTKSPPQKVTSKSFHRELIPLISTCTVYENKNIQDTAVLKLEIRCTADLRPE